MAKGLRRAIVDGAQQIATTGFVSTVCICIVFVQMFFLTGVARYLFLPLAEAVVFAVFASYLLSRTLVPTLVMWFEDHHQPAHAMGENPAAGWARPFVALQEGFERGFTHFRDLYRDVLSTLLNHRK